MWKWMCTHQIKGKEGHFQMDGLNLQNDSFLHQRNFHWVFWKGVSFPSVLKRFVKVSFKNMVYTSHILRKEKTAQNRWMAHADIFRAITPFQMEFRWLVSIWLVFNVLSRRSWSRAHTCFNTLVNSHSYVEPSQTMLTCFAEVKSSRHFCSIWTGHCEGCPRNGLGCIHFISSDMCQVLKKLASKSSCSWWNGMRSSLRCSEIVSFG